MVNISPSTLSVIAAALSGERAFSNVTHSRIEEALQSLLPGAQVQGSTDLQPGEYYLVWDADDGELHDFSTKARLDAWMEETVIDRNESHRGQRDIDDYLTIRIVRRNIDVEQKTTVELKYS